MLCNEWQNPLTFAESIIKKYSYERLAKQYTSFLDALYIQIEEHLKNHLTTLLS